MFEPRTSICGGKERKAYYSETEALEAAIYVQNRYNNDQVPYHCPECGMYHLSPKERQTESEECNYCTDSRGRPKQLYLNIEAAENRRRIREREGSIVLTVYRCPYRAGYHLTSRT
jgi:hypothetical protein